jgi:hypothetical protein
MAASKMFTLYAAKFGSSVLPLTDQSGEMNLQEYYEQNSGEVDPTSLGIGRIQPLYRLTTKSLSKAIALIGLNGLMLTVASPGVFGFRKIMQKGTRELLASALHETRTLVDGLVVLSNITAPDTDGNERATAQYEVHTCWDGTEGLAPVKIESGKALTGVLPTDDIFYVAGPVVLNGTITIPVRTWSLEPQTRVFKGGHSGHHYDDMLGIMGRQPRLRVTTFGMDLADDVGWDGLPITSVSAYLRACKGAGSAGTGAARWADGESKHVKIGATLGVASIASERAAQGDTPGALEISIPLGYDLTNPIFTMESGVAIT